MERSCRERTKALQRWGWVRLERALAHPSLPDGWECAARRACEEVGTVPGLLELHPTRYDPGAHVEWPSARDEWWAWDRVGDALVIARGDASGSLERFGEVLASKLRSLAVRPLTPSAPADTPA
jgi:hypothetical protein